MHKKHLRFGLLPFLLLACAPSAEDRGCKVESTNSCFLSGAGVGAPSGPIALDALAHVQGPKANESGKDQEATITIDPPDVARLLDTRVTVPPCSTAVARVKGLRAGKATLTFTFPDGQVTTASVEIVPAANARLVPYLDEIAAATKAKGEQPALESDSKQIVQAAGGKVVWRVAYTSASGAALRGSGATTYTLPEGATSTLVDNTKDRELFELDTPKVLPADAKLELRAATATLTVPVRVVPADAITQVRVYVQDTASGGGTSGDAGAKSKQLGVLARATDATGATVRGAPFVYTLGGAPVEPGGEILFVDSDPTAPERPLGASVPGSAAKGEALVAAAPNANVSRSSAGDFASCSYAPSSAGAKSAGAALALGLALAGLAARRRTRRDAGATRPAK